MNTRKLLLSGLALSAAIGAVLAMPAFAQQRDAQADSRNRDASSSQRSSQDTKAGDRAAQAQSDQGKAGKKDKAKRQPERELEEEDDR